MKSSRRRDYNFSLVTFDFRILKHLNDAPRVTFWKKVALLVAIIVVYAAVQLAISWSAIKWMMGGAA